MTKGKARRGISIIVDILIAFASLFAIFIFLLVLYHSIYYCLDLVVASQTLRAKMFFTGLLIAIVAGTLDFTQVFINSFAKSFRDIFRGGNE